jgi:type IV pilus assembly protein PilA
MLQRLRHRAGGQEGFTLIELLVVILIIGILAAVAIPAFINQKGKANDANAKSDARTAQTAEETYFTGAQAYTGTPTQANNGLATANLTAIEPTLTQALPLAGENLQLQSPATALYGGTLVGAPVPSAANSYDIAVTSKSTINYGIIRESDGTVQRVCKLPTAATNAAGCTLTIAGGTTGTW